MIRIRRLHRQEKQQKGAEIGSKSGDEKVASGASIISIAAQSEDSRKMVTYTPANISKFLVVKNQLDETRRKYKEEIARLEKEVEKERKAELQSVITEVKATIKRYELTAKDLGLSSRTGAPARKGAKASAQGNPSS
jgi:hypothetical protein